MEPGVKTIDLWGHFSGEIEKKFHGKAGDQPDRKIVHVE